jgi:hypothetical protein
MGLKRHLSIVSLVLIGFALGAPAWAGSGGGSGGNGLKGTVPEPAALLSLATGVGGALIVRWWRKK